MKIALLCIAVLAVVTGCGRQQSAAPAAQRLAQNSGPKAALTTNLIARTPDDQLVQLITDHAFGAIGDDYDRHADPEPPEAPRYRR